MKLIDSCPN